ncbi:hypothetical protein F5Y06DRAFT_266355 [Hypoxylon sp. FL0890]|nr:hypothetical protein F5Y06DRAFT_266355 [Hypoxylon sp. FL0890]
MVRRDEILDTDLSIRFKYGIHTIVLFVDPTKPFSDLADELLEILRARYPEGLSTSTGLSSEKTKLPDDPSQIQFAVPKSPIDLSQGWNRLKLGKKDTPVSKGIQDNSVIAFAFRPRDADEDFEVEFEVDFPRFQDEYEEEQSRQGIHEL